MMASKKLSLTEDNPYTRLTLKQKNYVEARLQGLTIAAASRAAGLADRAKGYVMEKNPKVRAAIKYLINESVKDVDQLSKSDVMQGMLDAVQAASTSTELVNAWRELGKLIGAYEPEKKVLEIRDYTKDELKALSDEELAQLSGSKYADAIDGEFYEVRGEEEEDVEDREDTAD